MLFVEGTACKATFTYCHCIIIISFYSFTDDLIAACQHNHVEIVSYLLKEFKCDPNKLGSFRQIPLNVARDNKIIRLLLQHGADVRDVYNLRRAALDKLHTEIPKNNPVKMFIIGNGGEGKSTLMETMQHEGKKEIGTVTEVSKHTAGIVHKDFESKIFGNIQFSDFAGQNAYHGSHAAIIRSSVVACPPVFMLVVSVRKNDDEIMQVIKYWLSIVANQCTNIEGKAPLIVVGSHLDLFPKSGKRDAIVKRAVNRYLQFDFHGFLAMDCRQMNSPELESLRKIVKKACASVKSRVSISLNANMFHIFLLDSHKNDNYITLKCARSSIKAQLIDEEQSKRKKEDKVLPFIPSEYSRLKEICLELTDTGYILFIENQKSLKKSFIVIDQTVLTADVNGSIFAPEGFKEHRKLASSTGIVPRSKLVVHFPGYDIDLIVGFLSYRELAIPVMDSEILTIIQHESDKNQLPNSEEVFLFCPGLIWSDPPTDEVQKRIMEHSGCNFCWISYCREEYFFGIRLVQVLLLRLALSQSCVSSTDSNPSLMRFCGIWKTGIFWQVKGGIFVLIEIKDNSKCIILQIHSKKMSLEFIKLRSDLINKISSAIKEFCPTVYTRDVLVEPSEVKHSMKNYSELPSIEMKSLAKCIVKCEKELPIPITNDFIDLDILLPEEVYANLDTNMLQAFFNKDKCKEIVSDKFLDALVSKWSEKLCQLIQPAFGATTSKIYYDALKTWRDNEKGTYELLRSILDRHSVFCGNNLLVSYHT